MAKQQLEGQVKALKTAQAALIERLEATEAAAKTIDNINLLLSKLGDEEELKKVKGNLGLEKVDFSDVPSKANQRLKMGKYLNVVEELRKAVAHISLDNIGEQEEVSLAALRDAAAKVAELENTLDQKIKAVEERLTAKIAEAVKENTGGGLTEAQTEEVARRVAKALIDDLKVDEIQASVQGILASIRQIDFSGLPTSGEKVNLAAFLGNVQALTNSTPKKFETVNAQIKELSQKVKALESAPKADPASAADAKELQAIKEQLEALKGDVVTKEKLVQAFDKFGPQVEAKAKAQAQELIEAAKLDPSAPATVDLSAVETQLAQLADRLGNVESRAPATSSAQVDSLANTFIEFRQDTTSRFEALQKAVGARPEPTSFSKHQHQATQDYFAENEDRIDTAGEKLLEKLGLAASKSKKNTVSKSTENRFVDTFLDCAFDIDGNQFPLLSDEKTALVRVLQSLNSVTQTAFGFDVNALTTYNGKAFTDLKIKTASKKDGTALLYGNTGDFESSFVKTEHVEQKERKFVLARTTAPFRTTRDENALAYATIRMRLQALFAPHNLRDHNVSEWVNFENVVHHDTSLGVTPAHLFALVGNVKALDQYLEHHPEHVDQPDAKGNTPLHYAAANFSALALEGEDYKAYRENTSFYYLINRGADQFARNEVGADKQNLGKLPIEIALATGNAAYIKCFMLENKAVTIGGNTSLLGEDDKYLLHRAVELGNAEAVLAVRHSLPALEVNRRNAEGNTAAHIACKTAYENPKGVNLLVIKALTDDVEGLKARNKASLTAKDSEGKTPLDLAIENNFKDVVAHLVEKGYKPSANSGNKVAEALLVTLNVARQSQMHANEGRMVCDQLLHPERAIIVPDKGEKHPKGTTKVTFNGHTSHAPTMDDTIDRIKAVLGRYKRGFAGNAKETIKLSIAKSSLPASWKQRAYGSEAAPDVSQKVFSSAHHTPLKEHLLACIDHIRGKIRSDAERVGGRNDSHDYYAFTPEGYSEMEGEERNQARKVALLKSATEPAKLVLRELMIAYHILMQKLESGKGLSTTNKDAPEYATMLADLIIAVSHQIDDAYGYDRMKPTYLLTLAHVHSTEEICALTIFNSVNSRDDLLKDLADFVANETGQNRDFDFLKDPSASSKSSRVRSEKEEPKKEEPKKEKSTDGDKKEPKKEESTDGDKKKPKEDESTEGDNKEPKKKTTLVDDSTSSEEEKTKLSPKKDDASSTGGYDLSFI